MATESDLKSIVSEAGRGSGLPSEQPPGRRTIVKGAAWTVPVLAASVAVPLAAASGTVNPSNPYLKSLLGFKILMPSAGGKREASFDGRKETFPKGDPGLFVMDTAGTEKITRAVTRFWISFDPISSIAAEGDSGLWTVPTYYGTRVIHGVTHYGYESVYRGTFTVAAGKSFADDHEFHFHSTGRAPGVYINVLVEREVTVDGNVLSISGENGWKGPDPEGWNPDSSYGHRSGEARTPASTISADQLPNGVAAGVVILDAPDQEAP